jgi:hypothetical protein
MLVAHLKKSFGFYLALVIFLASGSGSLFAFQAICGRERMRSSLWDAIPSGERDFRCVSRGECVGTFTTSVKQEGDTRILKAKGRINAAYQGVLLPAELEFTAYFNSLEQMIVSYLTVSAAEVEIGIGTRNINPLNFDIKLRSKESAYRYETSVPGPVELNLNKDGTYRLRYARLEGLQSSGLSAGVQPWLSALDFKILPASSPELHCSAELSKMDLTVVITLLQRSTAQFAPYLSLGKTIPGVPLQPNL